MAGIRQAEGQRVQIRSNPRSFSVSKAVLLCFFLVSSINLFGDRVGRPPEKRQAVEAQHKNAARAPSAPQVAPTAPVSIGHRIAYGLNDFMSFYAAAKLCGTRDLYVPESALKEEQKATGYFGSTIPIVRLPYFAIMLSPLSHFPYRTAYIIFQALSIISILVFIAMQRTMDGRARALLVCLTCFPLILSVCLGQDVTFVVLLTAVFMRYWDSKPGLAGVALALCTVKYHLFLFMPLVLLLHWRRRLAAALAVALAALAAVSFAVAGAAWPQEYVKQIRRSWDVPTIMPNIRALLLGTERPLPYCAILSIIVSLVAITALVRCRRSLPLCTAIALTAGVLVSYHVYVQDCAVLVPPLLALWNSRTKKVLVGLVWALLAPVPYLLRMTGGDLTYLIQFCLLAFIVSGAVLGQLSIQGESPEVGAESLANTSAMLVPSPALRS